MTRRLATVVAALALLGGAGAASAAAADWHSDQPLTPGSDVPVALGRIYDIRFWAPNRGLLITAKGLWAYDGTGWRPLSTVCGGTGGRIAWAGPLDFWTISDQPASQVNLGGVSLARRSLCHFVNGAVVASYAQPIDQAGSYEPMNAAACRAPDDCWFGGERLSGDVNTGAFHLHWDGTTLTPWPSLTQHDASVADPDRTVVDMATHQGEVYESVSVSGNAVTGESSDAPILVHQIFGGTPPAFSPLFPVTPVDYAGRPATALSGPQLSSDGDALWAAAGANDPNGSPVPATVLRLGPDGLAPLTLTDPDGVLAGGVAVSAIAAEPGTGAAWIGYVPGAELGGNAPARLVRIGADGAVTDATVLPSAADALARKQQADRLACPATGQCWMATQLGWLFHLGGDLPRDGEPAMHGLITFRPPDASTPVLPPDTLPDDDSGIAPPVFYEPPPVGATPPSTAPPKAKAKKLVTGVKRRLVKRTTLELSFTLTARARVQLVAKRKKTVVARTKRATLSKGKHKLRLRLNARRWPTALDLRATPYAAGETPADDEDIDPDDNPDAGPVTISSVRRSGR